MSALAPHIWLLLISTPVAIAIGQVLFKKTSERLVAGDAAFLSIAFDPLFIAALGLYGGATILWIYVLKFVPLSYAYAFMALTFVFVPLMASFWLGESLTLKFAIGASLIIAGLMVVQS